MQFLTIYSVYYDTIADLLILDKEAFLASVYGILGGLLGTFLRNILITHAKPNSKKEGFGHYFGFCCFGAAFALTVHSWPVVSLVIGTLAPGLFKGLTAMTPTFVQLIADKIPLIFSKKTEKD